MVTKRSLCVLGLPQDVRVDKDVPFNQLGKKD
jgi:hypothetical protein